MKLLTLRCTLVLLAGLTGKLTALPLFLPVRPSSARIVFSLAWLSSSWSLCFLRSLGLSEICLLECLLDRRLSLDLFEPTRLTLSLGATESSMLFTSSSRPPFRTRRCREGARLEATLVTLLSGNGTPLAALTSVTTDGGCDCPKFACVSVLALEMRGNKSER